MEWKSFAAFEKNIIANKDRDDSDTIFRRIWRNISRENRTDECDWQEKHQ